MPNTTPTSVAAEGAGGDPAAAAELKMHMYRIDAVKMLADQGVAKPAESDIKAWALMLQQKDEKSKEAQQMQMMQEAAAARQQAAMTAPNLSAPPPPAAAGMMSPGDAGPPLSQMLTAFGAR